MHRERSGSSRQTWWEQWEAIPRTFLRQFTSRIYVELDKEAKKAKDGIERERENIFHGFPPTDRVSAKTQPVTLPQSLLRYAAPAASDVARANAQNLTFLFSYLKLSGRGKKTNQEWGHNISRDGRRRQDELHESRDENPFVSFLICQKFIQSRV